MGSLSNVSRNFQSFNKCTILSLQIVIKCQHFFNISYFYVYMHVDRLLLFKINTTLIVNIAFFFLQSFEHKEVKSLEICQKSWEQGSMF